MVLSGRHQRRPAALASEQDAAAPAGPVASPLAWPDELELARLCDGAVSGACDADAVSGELLRESLLAELLAEAPRDLDELAQRVADVALGLGLDDEQVGLHRGGRATHAALCTKLAPCALPRLNKRSHSSQVPPDELAAALWRAVQAWREAVDAASGELLPPGCCELCERRMPLTRHHLIPRSQHAVLRARGATQVSWWA